VSGFVRVYHERGSIMVKSSSVVRAPSARVVRLWLAIASMLLLGACYPGDQLSVEEADVVVTIFDEHTDFAAFSSYAMPDSIVHIVVENGDDLVSRAYDAEILAAVESNMLKLGYTEETVPTDADVLMLVSATAREEVGYAGYGWGAWGWYYPYAPSWGWGWYPWYGGGGTIYTYQVGTLFIQMLDPAQADSTLERVPTVWIAALNGVANEAVEQRILDGIDQAFEQSPYLGEGK
jgi:hypothetical protein